MVRVYCIFCLVAVAFICAGKFTSQPQTHRLMESGDFLWKLFAQCEIRSNQDYSYGISYVSGVKAMQGKQVTISGFMVPLEAAEKSGHFLLSRRAPTCAFCPPGEPNEIVEVFTLKPVKWNENLVTISGTLLLANDGKKGIFFQMRDVAGI